MSLAAGKISYLSLLNFSSVETRTFATRLTRDQKTDRFLSFHFFFFFFFYMTFSKKRYINIYGLKATTFLLPKFLHKISPSKSERSFLPPPVRTISTKIDISKYSYA